MKTMPLTFRTASSSDDLTAIVRMLSDDPLGKTREEFREPLPSEYVQAFKEICNDPNQELIVAESDGEIIAVCQLSFLRYLTYRGGLRAQIEGVRVRNSHRSLGIGRALIHHAIERAGARGAHLLQLTTDKQRPEAVRFYRSLGFTDSHEGMKLDLILFRTSGGSTEFRK